MTNEISKSKTPLLHEVIPLFDILTRALDDHVDDGTLPPAIRVAAARGRKMLNKYYGLTDDSILYRIAMCKYISIYSHISLFIQCYTRNINLRTSPRQHGLAIGLRLLKPCCVRYGTYTTTRRSRGITRMRRRLWW